MLIKHVAPTNLATYVAIEVINIVTQIIFLKIFHAKDRLKFSEDSDIRRKRIIILSE